MRTLKLALAAAIAAFAVNANAAATGMTILGGTPPNAPAGGEYQNWAAGTDIGNGRNQVFHGGGVAACDGCHVMHNAGPGPGTKSTTGLGNSVQPWTNVGNSYLLQGSDQSSTCLICHGAPTANARTFQFIVASVDATTGGSPGNYTPAGDFGWTLVGMQNSASERHGHNVVAADYSFAADNLFSVAPGGSFTVSPTGVKALACSSCHDPHGRYRWVLNGASYQIQGPSAPNSKISPIVSSGSYGTEPTATTAVGVYRLLGGQGYMPASNPSYPFPNNPPIAIAPGTYNQLESPANETRVAYGTGMSEWCQNCHTNIHLDGYTTGVAGLRHPAGSNAFLHATQYDIYNTYVSSGNMNGNGHQYTSLVPFEQGPGLTFTQLKANTAMSAVITAGATSNVMCLSCHRAHASAFDNMVRWDQQATFLTDASAFTSGLTDRTTTQTAAGYYGRAPADLGPYQRSLCNKCHGKD